MAHGEADYTRTIAAKIIGSSVELDLPVILLDRFSSANLLWNGLGTGADWDVLQEAAAAYEGDAGLALRTRFTGPILGDWVRAERYAYSTPTSKMSFSALFRLNQDRAFMDALTFRVAGVYAGTQYIAALQYDGPNERWEYVDTTATWIPILGDIDVGPGRWHRIYFEFDMMNNQYLRFETDSHNVNMQGIPMATAGVGNLTYAQIRITANAAVNGTRADISIDNIILKELGS